MSDEKPTLLVVDDDLDCRDTLQDVLQDAGYAVMVAADGLEALDALRHADAPPALIVLDLTMPRMSGWEFCEARRRDALLATIPVLLASGEDDLGATAHRLGASAWLPKPYDTDRLLAVVDHLSHAH